METYMAVIWVVAGMVLMGLIVWYTMPSVMLIRVKSDRSYADTITALGEALKTRQDWIVKADNDYQKSTAGFAAIERVGSLNVCNPRYASKILSNDADRRVTALMPLAIGVYEDRQGQVHVSRLNIGLLGKMFGGTIAEVMSMADKDLGKVLESVTAE